jgi:hypothetical protein
MEGRPHQQLARSSNALDAVGDGLRREANRQVGAAQAGLVNKAFGVGYGVQSRHRDAARIYLG